MIRIGLGYDLHCFEPGRRLVLGGYEIDHDMGLTGHSDADALCHAITDALLGALALGDIGGHFPDNDPRYKEANSLKLLEVALNLVHGAGFDVVNVDTVVVTQAPKLQPHVPGMRQRLAETLKLPKDRISIKAKTNEGVGPEGRGEALSAQAIVLLESA